MYRVSSGRIHRSHTLSACPGRFFIFLLILLSRAVLAAQEDDIHWVPLDVPQLSESQVQWLDAVTRYPDSPMYSEAIGFLEQQVYNGEVSSADKAAVQLLRRIAMSPYTEQTIGSDAFTADVPQRQRAVHLLGYIGGEFSLDAVDEILSHEQDPAVLMSVFFVYQEIAPPFNDYRQEYFAKILRRAVTILDQEQLTDSILKAVRSMHERTWSMNSEELFNEILGVVNSGMSYERKQQALSLARLIAGVEVDNE